MAGSINSTHSHQGQMIPLQDINPRPNTPTEGERATVSNTSPQVSVSSSALSPRRTRASQNSQAPVLTRTQTRRMTSAEIPKRVHAIYDPRRLVEHFFPPAPANARELLKEIEVARRETKESKPVNETRLRTFLAKRAAALALEHQAALAAHQAELLSSSATLGKKLEQFQKDAPWQGTKEFTNAISKIVSSAALNKKMSQTKERAQALQKQVAEAWDDALVDYLAAHGLDRETLKAGHHRAGTRYALRVVPPAALGLASTAFGLMPADSNAGKFYVSLGSMIAVLALAGVVIPTSYAASTLTSVTWSDALFDNAANIQNLLSTPMVEAVAKRLSEANQSADQAKTRWRNVRDGSAGEEAKNAARQELKAALLELKGAQFDFLMRVDLNRIYIQGFQNQGLLNGLKFYGNLLIGPISAAISPVAGWLTQTGIATAHFAGHMAVSGDDEDSKQMRMWYLRMRACDLDLGPADGPGRNEEQVQAGLETFSKEKRSPDEVRDNALKEILTTALRKVENGMADIVGLQPNDINVLVRWKEFEASGGEAVDMEEGEQARGRALDARVETILQTKKPEDVQKYNQLMADRSRVATDIRHIDQGTISEVSDENLELAYYGAQVTPSSSGIVDRLKGLLGPVSPEFRLGMAQGVSRIVRPEEWATTLGLAYWAAFQLAICGENGPLILSKIVNFAMAVGALSKGQENSKEAIIAVQSALSALNLAVTVVLIYASAKEIDMALQPKEWREWSNRFSGGRSAVANTVYLGGLLNRRVPHRAEQKRTESDAGFQRVGMGALATKDYWSQLKKTLGAGMADLAKEAPSAGKARDGYIAAAALEEEIHQDLADDALELDLQNLGIDGIEEVDDDADNSPPYGGESSRQGAGTDESAPQQTKTQSS